MADPRTRRARWRFWSHVLTLMWMFQLGKAYGGLRAGGDMGRAAESLGMAGVFMLGALIASHRGREPGR
jgi:hypothetical protein